MTVDTWQLELAEIKVHKTCMQAHARRREDRDCLDLSSLFPEDKLLSLSGPGAPSEEECVQACVDDASCVAAVYSYSNLENTESAPNRFGPRCETYAWCPERSGPFPTFDFRYLYRVGSTGGVSDRKDPHLSFAHGGHADFRGEHDAVFNFLSARNVSLNLKTVLSDFQ